MKRTDVAIGNDASGRRPSRADAEAAIRTLIAWPGDDAGGNGPAAAGDRLTGACGALLAGDRADPAAPLEPPRDDFGGEDRVVLLVAKSAFAAAPHGEMRRVAAIAGALPGIERAAYAFTEQGTPSLREALLALRSGGVPEILIVPLMLPMEPGFRNWLHRSLGRWQAAHGGPWPRLRVARGFADSAVMPALLADLVTAAEADDPIAALDRIVPEGSLVPPQKRRVLVCQGGPCNAAGAAAIWAHLRNLQERRKLRVVGDGVMTAKTTCLGPCGLAPVLQAFPEGTYYGGVTEEAVERIVEQHLLGGKVVDDFAYAATGRRQTLRTPRAATRTRSSPRK